MLFSSSVIQKLDKRGHANFEGGQISRFLDFPHKYFLGCDLFIHLKAFVADIIDTQVFIPAICPLNWSDNYTISDY